MATELERLEGMTDPEEALRESVAFLARARDAQARAKDVRDRAIEQLRVDRKMPVSELAPMAGLRESTLAKWLQRRGIRLTPVSERGPDERQLGRGTRTR